jgi:hypothetical protein
MMLGMMKVEEIAVVRQPFCKRIPLAMSTHTTIEELLDNVFCVRRQSENIVMGPNRTHVDWNQE